MNPVYSVMILLCVIASIGMGFHVYSNTVLVRRSKLWFIAVYVCTALGAIAEYACSYMDIHPVNGSIHLAVKVLEFCITPLFPVLIAFGCGMEKRSRPVGILGLAHVILEIILAPFGKIIRFDEAGIYHRGEWYWLYIAVYTVSFFYMLIMFVNLSRRFRNRDLVTLFSALFSILCGVVPSVINSSIRTAFMGITITAIILYIYYEGLTMQDMAADILTKKHLLVSNQEKIIIGIADLIESRDVNTGTHVKHTAGYVKFLTNEAMKAGIYPETINAAFAERIIRAAPLHDIGKIAIPDSILLKPGKFTEEEFEIMKRHAPEGGRIVLSLLDGITDEESLRITFDVANYHHERWDGTGYPEGLSGENIPVCARIMAIADVYDALTMERVYKEAVSPAEALQIIEEASGKQFDPLLAPLFVRVMRERYLLIDGSKSI